MNVFGLWVDFIVTVKNNTDARKYSLYKTCQTYFKTCIYYKLLWKFFAMCKTLFWNKRFHIHKLIKEQNNKTLFLQGKKKKPFKKSRIQNDCLRLVVLKVWSLDQHHLRTYYKCRFSGPTYTYWIRNWV